MDNVILVIVTALISGLLATIVTILWQSKVAIRNNKMKIFETLMSYRYQIVAEPSVHALNSIDVIFYKDAKVRQAYSNFLDETVKRPEMNPNIADKHLKLLEEMAKALNLKNIHWDDIKQAYCPTGLSEKIHEEELLRKMQLQSVSNSLESRKNQQNTPIQEQANQQLLAQILPELIKNPESMKTLIELGTKFGNTK
ncbi:MAG: hypothetical protein IJC74_01555 [Clostridia bacterium]|nr:hypothetical protein [Clostridia bacterium]